MPRPLGFLICVLIWGSTWYFVALQLGVVPKEWSVAYRFALASVLLFALSGLRGHSLRLTARQHLTVAVIGLFMFSTNYILIYGSTQYLTSGLVAVAFSLLTILNILNARFFLGTTIQASVLVASVLGIIGLILVFAEEVGSLSLGDATLIGLGYGVAATICASFGNTMAATRSMASMPLLVANGWGMLYGTAFNAGIALIVSGAPVFDTSMQYVGSLLYLSVFGTVAAFTVYMWLIATWGVARSAYMAVLTPVVALIISTLFEGFEWTVMGAAGLALILIGNIMMIRSRQRAPEGDKTPVPQAEPDLPLKRPEPGQV